MTDNIQSVLNESRVFEPPEAFRNTALISDPAEFQRLYQQSLDDPAKFWGDAAKMLHWFEPWIRVMEWDEPHVRWFVGGKTNLAYNCLDLQVERGLGQKVAFHWEGEPGDTRTLTYSDMLLEVSKFANVLKDLGVTIGMKVAIYMPMIPEAVIAMLACARIGATHSVVFGGFSSHALSDRINDAKAEVVITADGGYRRGQVLPLKPAVDEALETTPSVRKVVVVNRANNDIVTISYPDEKRIYPERFRGVHRLTHRTDGSPRCVACLCCSTVCPAQCIHIEAAEYPGVPTDLQAPFSALPVEGAKVHRHRLSTRRRRSVTDRE